MTCFRKSVGFFFARGGATALLVSALEGTAAPVAAVAPVAFVLLMNSIKLSEVNRPEHRPIKNPVAQHETRFFDFAADFDQINFELI